MLFRSDRFAAALRSIANEIKENPDIVKGAPYTKLVGRLDEVAAARKPNLRWTALSQSDGKEDSEKKNCVLKNL